MCMNLDRQTLFKMDSIFIFSRSNYWWNAIVLSTFTARDWVDGFLHLFAQLSTSLLYRSNTIMRKSIIS